MNIKPEGIRLEINEEEKILTATRAIHTDRTSPQKETVSLLGFGIAAFAAIAGIFIGKNWNDIKDTFNPRLTPLSREARRQKRKGNVDRLGRARISREWVDRQFEKDK